MEVTREQLAEKFKLYADDELRELVRSGDLSELATEVARAELARRGIDAATPAAAAVTPSAEEPGEPREPVIDGDLVEVARMLDPVEAEMVRGRLEAEGVPAMVADTNTAHMLFRSLIGGVRVLVPEAYLDRAREILKADARGDYALDDRTDVGPPTDTP
jgi:Putative prokaryotic signal transducing protein